MEITLQRQEQPPVAVGFFKNGNGFTCGRLRPFYAEIVLSAFLIWLCCSKEYCDMQLKSLPWLVAYIHDVLQTVTLPDVCVSEARRQPGNEMEISHAPLSNPVHVLIPWLPVTCGAIAPPNPPPGINNDRPSHSGGWKRGDKGLWHTTQREPTRAGG